jgi:4-amino-4-deoxy-L-arabinose transferase-like glycosyltransferase
LISIESPVWIGISQLNDRPFYYQIVSLPLQLLRGSDVIIQLYAARMVSLGFYLITIFASYGVITNFTKNHHPLRWMVPLFLALLPGFSDIMTAVNNDVGATAFFSLFLWASVQSIQRGLTWWRFFLIGLTVILCTITKNTVFVAVPLLILALLASIFRPKKGLFVWISIGLLTILALVALGTNPQAIQTLFPGQAALIRDLSLIRTASIIHSLQNWEAAEPYYKQTMLSLFRTFWAKFGWGHVPLLGGKPYRILGALTITGTASCIFALIRKRDRLPRRLLVFMGTASILIWLAALFRGVGTIATPNVYIPVARYAAPAIIPTAILLVFGSLEGMRWFSTRFKVAPKYPNLFYITALVVLDLVSIWSIARYYYS